MTTETTTVAALIEALGLTMTAEPAKSNPNASDEWSKGAAHWLCTIRRGAGSLGVPFSQGAGHRSWTKDAPLKMRFGGYIQREFDDVKPGQRVQQYYLAHKTLHHEAMLRDLSEPTPPDLASVLDCLASDSSAYDNARDFEDWCAEFGMDTDSRKAEATYRVCGEQAKRLRHFLGDDGYQTLLFKCERL